MSVSCSHDAAADGSSGGVSCLQRLDINSATHTQLQQRLKISSARATAICQRRQSLGGFESVECLRAIAGVTPRFIERISSLVTCSASSHESHAARVDALTHQSPAHEFPGGVGDDVSSPLSTSNCVPSSPHSATTTKRSCVLSAAACSPHKKPCLSAVDSASFRQQTSTAAAVASSSVQPPDSVPALSGDGHDTDECRDPSAMHAVALHPWLDTYMSWSGDQRLSALDQLLDVSEASQVRHILHAIQPRFQRDFIALLPRELALHVLSYLPAADLLRAACTCRVWRHLAEDNLLWREKCRELQLDDMQEMIQVRRRCTISATTTSTAAGAGSTSASCTSDTLRHCHSSAAECRVGNQACDSGATCTADEESVCCAACESACCGGVAASTTMATGDGDTVMMVDDSVSGDCGGGGGGVTSTAAAAAAAGGGGGGVEATLWKQTYIRRMKTEANWRTRPLPEPKVLSGHDDHVVTCLQFSGSRVVSGSDDNTLKVWCVRSGRCLRTLIGHTGGVWSSQMDSRVVISGSTDRTLKIWNMETGACLHTLYGHSSTVRCMHLHGKKVVSGSRDATLRVWDVASGQCEHVLVGHVAAVRCVQYDGRLVVSGAYDYMVKVWRPDTEQCLHTLQGHNNRVYSLQFDGVHVVSGSLDTSIRVWDVETGQCRHTLMGHQSLTSGMELRNNILVSGNADSTVKVWDIGSGQCLQTLSGPHKHQSAVTCLQFHNNFVVTSSDDGTVKLWDVKSGQFVRNLVSLASGGSGGVVWRIRASRTKLVCAVGSRNGTEETKLMVLDFEPEK